MTEEMEVFKIGDIVKSITPYYEPCALWRVEEVAGNWISITEILGQHKGRHFMGVYYGCFRNLSPLEKLALEAE